MVVNDPDLPRKPDVLAPDVLAQRFDVSRSRITRDIDTIEHYGIGSDPETTEMVVRGTIDDLTADLAAIIPWLSHPAFLADPERVARFTSALDYARDQLPGVYFDCSCPDREAIVTGDGMICGTCQQPINPDPALAV